MGVGIAIMSKDRAAIIPRISLKFAAPLSDLQWLFWKLFPLSDGRRCLFQQTFPKMQAGKSHQHFLQ